MTQTDPAPHLNCSICSGLNDYEYAFQKGGREDEATYLPPAASLLVPGLNPGDGSRLTELVQCPECGTYYLYHSDYEFLVGGSEDEQSLRRLSPEEAARYQES